MESEVLQGTIGNRTVAVKKLYNPIDKKKFEQEVQCIMKARHRNIVRFLGYCADTQGEIIDYEGKFVVADLRNWLLCFEFVPKGSLQQYISGRIMWHLVFHCFLHKIIILLYGILCFVLYEALSTMRAYQVKIR